MIFDLTTLAPVIVSAFAAALLARFVLSSYARPATSSARALSAAATGGMEQILSPLPRRAPALLAA